MRNSCLVIGFFLVLFVSSSFSKNEQRKQAEKLCQQGYDILYHQEWLASTEDKIYAEHAIELFEQAIALDSTFAKAYTYLPFAYWIVYFNGKMEEPEAKAKGEWAAQKAMKLDPKGSMSLVASAFIIKQYSTNYEQAAKMLKKASQIDPQNSEAHRELAWLYTTMSDFESALGEAKRACETDEKSTAALDVLGRVYLLLEQFELAFQTYDQYRELQPKSMKPYWEQSYIYVMTANYKKGENLMRAGLEKYPDNNGLKNNLSWFIAQQGQLKEALALVEETGWQNMQAWLHARLGDTQQTRERIAELEKMDGWWQAWNVAWLYQVMGENEKSIDWLEETLIRQKEQLHLNLVHWGWRLAKDPQFDELRSSERFQAVIEKTGYKEQAD